MSDQIDVSGFGSNFEAQMIARAIASGELEVRGHYHVECYGPDGNLKWEDEIDNLVTNAGLDHILSIVLKGGTQVTSWYIGLKGTGSAAAADTMASHAGWTEIHTEYSQATRPAWTGGSVSGGSVDNSASKATFSFTGSATVAGCFLVSNSTKNGSTGTLYSAGDFTGGNKTPGNGDTLEVTATFTAARPA